MRKLVRYRELPSYGVTFSRAHLTRLIREGKFPRPVKDASARNGAVAWLESDLIARHEALLATKIGGVV